MVTIDMKPLLILYKRQSFHQILFERTD